LGISLVGFGPILGWLALATLWNRPAKKPAEAPGP